MQSRGLCQSSVPLQSPNRSFAGSLPWLSCKPGSLVGSFDVHQPLLGWLAVQIYAKAIVLIGSALF